MRKIIFIALILFSFSGCYNRYQISEPYTIRESNINYDRQRDVYIERRPVYVEQPKVIYIERRPIYEERPRSIYIVKNHNYIEREREKYLNNRHERERYRH